MKVRTAMPYYVYMPASQTRGTLYIGVTNDMARRAWEHREGNRNGFTKEHSVKRIVMVEIYADVREAIRREKRLKRWKHAWKIALIEENGPTWTDLCDQLHF